MSDSNQNQTPRRPLRATTEAQRDKQRPVIRRRGKRQNRKTHQTSDTEEDTETRVIGSNPTTPIEEPQPSTSTRIPPTVPTQHSKQQGNGTNANPKLPIKPKPEDRKSGYTNKTDFRRETKGNYGRPSGSNPHANKDCYLCKKTGHIARFCPTSAFFFGGPQDEEKKEEGEETKKEENLNAEGGQ
ncbi:unnamed protein product [Orchesella dallaii]|uniref:CCHC-type domain-containing protein n=1 Tax=Orchesella dallaii TaxID=48710 RepID=A0ABP1RX40_9HEXA